MPVLQIIVVMLVGFAIGLPVAYSLLVPSLIYLYQQQVPLYLVAQKMANGVESFPLLAIPFFIAAGEMMNTGGVTRRLVNLASTVVGHITGGLAHVTIVANGVESFPLLAIPFFIAAGEMMNTGGVTRRLVNLASTVVGHITGGLAHVTIVANMIMAGMSGSAIADAAGTGRVLIPAMEQEKFDKPFAAAIVSAAGTIGPIIPPSIPFVLFGFIASTSVGRLFLGGIIPGILMGLFLMVTVYIVAKRRHYPRHKRATLREFWTAFREASWALVMPLLILGGILTGKFTPTEAAGMAALYGLFVGFFIYKEITLRDLLPIATRVVRSSAVVLFIVAAASVLQYILTREMVGESLLGLFKPFAGRRVLALLLVNLLFLALGCVMETTALLLLFTPIFLPLIDGLGMDRVHFGVFFILNLMIGTLTPPVGTVMYVILNISRISMVEFTREIWPMLVALIAVLFIITFYPPLVLYVPNLFMGVAK